jgi:hypothetical protein
MTLDLALASPPEHWFGSHIKMATPDRDWVAITTAMMDRASPLDDYEDVPGVDDPMVVHASDGKAWWTVIPRPIHLHLTDAAADVVRDGMATLGMMIDTDLDGGRLEKLDGESHRWFIATDSGADGIPAYKVSGEHQWLAAPREIDAALLTYTRLDNPTEVIEDLLGPESLPPWERWIAYLRLASRHGGFRVETGQGSARDLHCTRHG